MIGYRYRMRQLGGWIGRHAQALTVLVVCAGLAIGVVAFQAEQDRADDRDAAQARARRTEICDSFDDLQAVSRDLINVVLDPGTGGGGGLPLTSIPEFQQLDGDTQAYLVALSAAVIEARDDNPNDLVERLATFRDDRLGPDDLPEFCS